MRLRLEADAERHLDQWQSGIAQQLLSRSIRLRITKSCGRKPVAVRN
jgi:hypothetical protein